MSLEQDLEILNDDYDRLVALESLGMPPDYPAIAAIRQRWCLDDVEPPFVAGESTPMERAQAVHDAERFGRVSTVYAGKAARSLGRGAHAVGRAGRPLVEKGARAVGRASHQLAARFVDFADEIAKDTTKKIKHATNKATLLENQMHKLRKLLAATSELSGGKVETGKWTSKVCMEDKVDVDKIIEFCGHSRVIEARINDFTVKVRGVLKSNKELDGNEVERIGKSTNWAIKRAAGLVGIASPLKEVKATCFGGNVIVVENIKGNVTYAVARDGDYGDTIEALSRNNCDRALEAVGNAIDTLKGMGVKRKVGGYTAIDEDANELKANLKNVVLKDLRRVTGYYKSSMALNDAFATAMVRSAEGLLEYVRLSIKGD
ncbi:hypothetical protein pEaSNUABM11_00117 [Erwinia phage pEa_SNUABM_11]|nr:hypothetical protein pEaSNUABM11_00117 [Erwinia phage pEa_SNUABM_11]